MLRRAVELEGSDERALPEAGGLTSEALVAAAIEAGIDEGAVRRSLAIERLGPPPRRGGLTGAAVVVVTDEVDGTTDEVLHALDTWLVSGHHLRRDRLRDGAGTWSRRRGMLGSVFRSLRQATGEGGLGDLDRIDVAAVDCGEGSCVVRVAADRHRERRVRAAAGAAVATVTTAGVVVAAALVASPVLLAAAPVTAVAAGAGVAATGRRRAARVAGELERVLDDVEHGVRPTRLAPHLARRVTGRP